MVVRVLGINLPWPAGSPQVLIDDLGGNFDDNGDYDDAVDGYISLSINHIL